VRDHLHRAAPIIASILNAEDPETEHVVTVSERQRPGETQVSASGVDPHAVSDRDSSPALTGAPHNNTREQAA